MVPLSSIPKSHFQIKSHTKQNTGQTTYLRQIDLCFIGLHALWILLLPPIVGCLLIYFEYVERKKRKSPLRCIICETWQLIVVLRQSKAVDAIFSTWNWNMCSIGVGLFRFRSFAFLPSLFYLSASYIFIAIGLERERVPIQLQVTQTLQKYMSAYPNCDGACC